MVSGSSPHTRGARQAILPVSSLARIIPAYAGSTPRSIRVIQDRQDHPRIRGEHALDPTARSGGRGSSPHTRGAQIGGHRRAATRRIIPAYAGSTRSAPGTRSSYRDHPRIRGEHANFPYTVFRACGSSPHTRGARHERGQGGVDAGIIPAYAGSTPIELRPQRGRRDHPRIRGEHRRTGLTWPSQ